MSDQQNDFREESAKLTYESVLLLWQDQVSLAESLKERRKQYITIIAAMGAVGIFRFSWTRKADEVCVFVNHPIIEEIARWSAVVSIVLLLVACCLIVVESFDNKKRVEPQVIKVRDAKDQFVSEPENPDWSDEDDAVAASDRAVARTYLTSRQLAEAWEAHPYLVWQSKASALRRAYAELVWRNLAVKARLKKGMVVLGGSFLFLAITIIAYTLYGNTTINQDARGQQQRQSQAEPDPF